MKAALLADVKEALIPITVGVAIYGLIYWALPNNEPIFRRANVPEPATLAELRGIHRSQPKPEGTPARETEGVRCELPDVRPIRPMSVVIDPTATLEITLPGDWRRIGFDDATDSFRMPHSRYENAATDWRFTVYRVATGATGPTYAASTPGVRLPTEDCETSNGKAGVIWAFHVGERNGAPRYAGDGDAVSSLGRRYKFSISAPTRAARDSLAAFLSLAIAGVPPATALP